MKVLQVLCGRAWGGGSVVVLAITRALIARGDEVWVFSFEEETDRRFAEVGAKLVRPPLWFDAINPLDAVVLAHLWRLCRREKFDLVATHTSKGGFLGRIAARAAGVPHIVHHAHGFAFNKVLSPWTEGFYVMLERVAARFGDLIISVNEQHRQMAIELGVDDPHKIWTIHNGIDTRRFATASQQDARRRLGFDESVLLVGAIGRLAPQKGLTYLLRAFHLLSDRFPSMQLLISGIGPLQDELEREARELGISTRVHFLGFRRDVATLLAALDVYAQPSLWEGLSISLIEALAAGKPIVATDIDGNREVVHDGETALLVPPANPEALAHGLERVLNDASLARRLGNQARRAAAENFSQERMVEQNLAAYDWVSGARASMRPQGRVTEHRVGSG